ncbi:MAG: hypothetical protein OEM02_12280 [Desulfobulbaceae bacterium]|nr:hypothetical protein [Desulfobulbaceae bacterium]
MKLKCGQCHTIHSFNERNIPSNGVKLVRCDGCDNHFLISSDNTIKEKYDFSSRICPNCAKELPFEVMQCRYCEFYFSKDHRLKDNRIKKHREATSSTLWRKKKLIQFAIAVVVMVSLLWYFVMDKNGGLVSRFVREVSPEFVEGIRDADPYYKIKLVSGGTIHASSYAEKGDLLEIKDKNGTLFTVSEQEVVEIVRLR